MRKPSLLDKCRPTTTAGKPAISQRVRLGFCKDQRSGGSLPSLKPGEILGAGALAECFTGCWGDAFERGVWLGFPCADGPSSCVGTLLVLEPAVFVEPMLLAIVVSPGPRRPETYHSLAGFAAWGRGSWRADWPRMGLGDALNRASPSDVLTKHEHNLSL